jgi:hypothetical protein
VGVRASLALNLFTIALGGLVASLQVKFGLIPEGKAWLSAVINGLPYLILVLFFVAYNGLRAPWLLHQAEQREYAKQVEIMNADFEVKMDSLQSDLAMMRPQLENPRIVPIILSFEMKEVSNSSSPPSVIARPIGDKDTIVTIQVRLKNEYRVPGRVQSCWLEVGKGYGDQVDRIEIYTFPGFPTMRQAQAHAELLLNLPCYVEYGDPVSGLLHFKIDHRIILSLKSVPVQIAAEDSIGAVVKSEGFVLL